MQTKKVFSAAKYLSSMMEICSEQEIQDMIILSIYPGGWVWDCDGKTEQECKEIGFGLCPEWLIEIPQNENIDFWRNYIK